VLGVADRPVGDPAVDPVELGGQLAQPPSGDLRAGPVDPRPAPGGERGDRAEDRGRRRDP